MSCTRAMVDLPTGLQLPGGTQRRITEEIANFAVGVINAELSEQYRGDAEEVEVDIHFHESNDSLSCQYCINKAQDGK